MKKGLCAGLLALAVSTLTPAVFADPPPAKSDVWVIPPPAQTVSAPLPVAEAPAPSRSLWRYGAIALVLGGVVAFAYHSRKRGIGALPQSGGRLMLLDSLRIGPQAQLVVVAVSGKRMLLSVTGANIRRIASLDEWVSQTDSLEVAPAEERTPEEAREAYAPTVTGPSFGNMLRRFVTNLDGRVPLDPAAQIAEQTMDRVELRAKPPAARVTPQAPEPMASRPVRKLRNEDGPAPARKSAATPSARGERQVENQVAGLMARRSARGA